MHERPWILAALVLCAPLFACGEDGAGVPSVTVNEVVHSAMPLGSPDWVELYNPGGSAVDLSGWKVLDEKDSHVFTFPSGTTITGKAFLVVEGEGGTGAYVATFGWGTTDSARLVDADGVLVDSTSWFPPAGVAGTSWGRHPDGTGEFATLSSPTPAAKNAQPL